MAAITDVRKNLQSSITLPMNDGWRGRLKAAVEASGKSPRAVSLEAGRAHGYVFSLLNEGKDPTITNLSAVCRVLGVSLPSILYGQDVTPEGEELLNLVADADPKVVQGVLDILRANKKP
jgi:hypothetical protein